MRYMAELNYERRRSPSLGVVLLVASLIRTASFTILPHDAQSSFGNALSVDNAQTWHSQRLNRVRKKQQLLFHLFQNDERPTAMPDEGKLAKHPSRSTRRRISALFSRSPLDDEEEDTEDSGSSQDSPRMRDKIRGWFRSSKGEDEPPRVQSNFDDLFDGMPGMDDILGEGDIEAVDEGSSASSRGRRSSSSLDDGWFDDVRQNIVKNYDEILAEMLGNLETLRREDPDSVPENAEAMIKSVLKQEMDTELEETKEQMSRERLNSYEEQQLAELEQKDVSGPITDSRVRKLIDESEEEYERQVEAQLQLEDFLRYEDEAFREATVRNEQVVVPEPNADLDQWALERLQDMASKQEELDNDLGVLDILDENMEDLKERMEKESAKGELQPETMKDWQMYRSIANRMGVTFDTNGKIDDTESNGISDEEVFRRLQSWKQYNEKEDAIRQKGGLSRGPKLPFEWQELGESDASTASTENSSSANTREARMETRKQINRMSIEALESLMATSDAARQIKLQKEIDFLKRELESNDYLDWVEPEESEEEIGPVDLSGVFSSDAAESVETNPKPPTRVVDPQSIPLDSGNNEPPPPPPPSTPFFEEVETVKPPSTPFFSDAEADMEVASTDSKLGTMEDQKLEAMFRKGGVRSKEEQQRIRSGYEDFKRMEEEKRRISGLGQESEEDFTKLAAQYNVSQTILENGDVDAEKVLSMIGPRPKRRSKQPGERSENVATKPDETQLDREDADPSLASKVKEEDVASSLYRSVAAAGGGRFKDDEEAKSRDMASYMEYLEMEKNMRANVDNMPEESITASMPEDIDVDDYAKQAMVELGPRPASKKYERVDEQYLSDTGAGIKDEDNDDIDDEDDSGPIDSPVENTLNDDENVPEWVRREKEASKAPRRRFLGSNDIEDAFSDDEYEKNMRQLAEYERRRAGKETRQMGIDISDILGPRRNVENDYDYRYDDDLVRGKRMGWGSATFESRKRDLMEYSELDVPLLNNLMDQKDAVSASGVSRYMAKINKPFKEFGAIFRLEGVIVDITGLQASAWSKTSVHFGARQPSAEEMKRAAVVRPEAAIGEIFAWTTDIPEIQQIVAKYRENFNEEFQDWAKNEGLTAEAKASVSSEEYGRGNLAIGEEIVQESNAQQSSLGPTLSENELLSLLIQSWSRTADRYKFPRPVQEQIVTAASMESDIAIREVFGWTADPLLVDDVAAYHRRVVDALKRGQELPVMEGAEKKETAPPARNQPMIDQNMLMELHYQAWTAVASKYGFEQPSSDEVLGAFVLNDPALVVKGGYGWTSDVNLAQEVAQSFTEKLRALLQNPSEPVYGEAPRPGQTTEAANTLIVEEEATSSPSMEDIVAMHSEAWISTCRSYGLDTPSLEQVRLSVNVEPADFVSRVMEWSKLDSEIDAISTTFNGNLRQSSESLIKKMGYAIPEQGDQKSTSYVDETRDQESDDLFEAAMSSWKAVSVKFRLPDPSVDQVLYAMSVGPEEAIRYGFRWTSDEENVSLLLDSYKKEVEGRRSKWAPKPSAVEENVEPKSDDVLVQVNSGSGAWIKSLMDVEMACGIISHLTRSQIDTLLNYAGISDLIDPEKRVASFGAGSLQPTVKHHFDTQQMLAAALRLERRPDHCVVLDASPGASLAARNVEMQSVAWIGSYPRYELLQADATVSRLDELTAMNIRRLFGERIYDQPLMDQQQAQPENNKKTKTSFDWGDD